MTTTFTADQPSGIYATLAGAIILGLIYHLLTGEHRPYPGIPIVSLEPPRGFKSWLLPAKPEYPIYGSRLVEKGKQLTSGCFQIRAGAGWKIIVPNHFVQEIGSIPQLSFAATGQQDFHTSLPGFEGVKEAFREDALMVDVVRNRLTQNLGLVTEVIVEETPLALQQILGDQEGEKAILIKEVLLDIVAWVATRVFAGEELARDENWRRASKQYTVLVFLNAHMLRRYPAFLRPLVNRFLPSCREMRKRLAEGRTLVERQLNDRLQQREQNQIDNIKSIDIFHWMMDVAKGRPLDFTGSQLQLCAVAINTTAELTVRCILQLCDSPDILPALREEMITVLKEHGWTNASLHKMKLLDSFIKETQRMDSMTGSKYKVEPSRNESPLTTRIATMARVAKQKVTLSDGTVFPAGSSILVMNDQLHDPNIYPEPDNFDPYRYLRLRAQPGEENKHLFATALPTNLVWGYGLHACSGKWQWISQAFAMCMTNPYILLGRFFASNLMKVILCHLLLKYDIVHEPGTPRFPRVERENIVIVDPRHRVRITRRKEELDLQNLKVA